MMRKPLLFVLLALLCAVPTLAQDTPSPLGAGYYEAEDLPWIKSGEWTTRTEHSRTYLTSGSRESLLTITVKGMYVLIYRVPEYGGGEMYVRMNECVELYLSQSAHDIGVGALLDIEGETDLTLQLGAGRLGIDAIEVMADSKKAERLYTEEDYTHWPANKKINRAYLHRQIGWEGDIPAKDCVKKPPQPTPVPPTATPIGYIAPTPQTPESSQAEHARSIGNFAAGMCLSSLVVFSFITAWAADTKKKNG